MYATLFTYTSSLLFNSLRFNSPADSCLIRRLSEWHLPLMIDQNTVRDRLTTLFSRQSTHKNHVSDAGIAKALGRMAPKCYIKGKPLGILYSFRSTDGLYFRLHSLGQLQLYALPPTFLHAVLKTCGVMLS